MPSFPGFSPKALTFFRQLEKNNTREWFQPRKALFEEVVRRPMVELVTLLCDDLRLFAADYVSDPAKSIYRIYRDTRFSKDKTPHKTHIAAHFQRSGLPKNAGAGYYFAVSHAGVDIGGGMYMPGPDELSAVRGAILKDDGAFRALVGDKKLCRLMGELKGDQLARVPKRYPADHPAGDLLRFKQFYYFDTLPADLSTGPKLRKTVVDRFKLMADVVNFLNDAALAAVKTADDGEASPRRPDPMF